MVDASVISQEVISNLTRVIGALGGIIFIYLIFNIITLVINRKKGKEILNISKNVEEIKNLLKKKK